ncbi:MFS transporter [Vibrio spartinae]|uniref:Inner membrane transport protein YdhP n=1 Tax=Vibrio spartinae TaxID=1918945 RepID=A0A1N6MBE4_9VIBR|nr:MFS transporter [Vibrio spartinae]SIO96769.1 Inner membrane transport protein YdhP [Vibrio spartinae]
MFRQESQYLFQTVILLIGVSVIGSNAFLMSPILSNIAQSLDTDMTKIAWSISAYGGAMALGSLFLTGLPQRIGLKSTLLLTGTVLSISILMTGLSTNWIMLVVAQTLTGISAGVLLPTLYSMTAIIAPKGKESTTLGKVISGWSLAMIAGVPLSAFVSELLSWRSAYFFVFILSLLSTLGYFLLPSKESLSTATSLQSAFQVPKAKSIFIITFFYMISFYGTYTFLGSYIQQQLLYSTVYAGMAVLSYGLGFGFAGIFLGKFIDKRDSWEIISPCLLFICGIYLLLLILSNHYWSLLIGCVFWGLINQVILNCLVSILNGLDDHQRVRLIGIYSAVSYGGTMVAALVYGVIYLYKGFHFILITSALLCLFAFLVLYGLKRHI